MLRQNRHRAERLDERGENIRGHHAHREIVHFRHREVFPVDHEQVARHVVDLRIVDHIVPGEDHVIGGQRLAVVPAQAPAQFEGPRFLVRLHAPRFGERWFHGLSVLTERGQAGKNETINVLRGTFVGRDGVERFGIAKGGDDQATARFARLALGDQRRFRQWEVGGGFGACAGFVPATGDGDEEGERRKKFQMVHSDDGAQCKKLFTGRPTRFTGNAEVRNFPTDAGGTRQARGSCRSAVFNIFPVALRGRAGSTITRLGTL